MISKNHKITLGQPKNKISRTVGTIFSPKQKKLSFFAVIAIKPLEIMFKKTIDIIRGVIQNYVKT